MGEYSASVPTGQIMWKMWRRDVNEPARRHGTLPASHPPFWRVGQYAPSTTPGYIGIRWYDVVIKSGPKPRHYKPPDWRNRMRYLRDRQKRRADRKKRRGEATA
jgi:hypothetical protein